MDQGPAAANGAGMSLSARSTIRDEPIWFIRANTNKDY